MREPENFEFGRLAKREIGVLAGLGAAALGLWGFAAVAEETFEGETRGLDKAILLALRERADPADPIGPAWLERAVSDVTSLGGYAILTMIVLGAACYLAAIGKRANALLLVGAAASGGVLSESLKLGFARPRPDLAPHLAFVQSASFPSGHAMLSAVIYLTLGALLARAHADRRVKLLVLSYPVALVTLVGLSRIYLGVHWPTDVLAGWFIGASWAALWWTLALWLQRAHLVEPSRRPGGASDEPN